MNINICLDSKRIFNYFYDMNAISSKFKLLSMKSSKDFI